MQPQYLQNSSVSCPGENVLLLSGKAEGCLKAGVRGLYRHLFSSSVATPLRDTANEDRRVVSIPKSLRNSG